GPGLRRRIIEALSTGPTLLVLDNCEHLIDGVAALVNDVLAAVAELRILTTSRTPLRHTAEHAYLLDQLPSAAAEELLTPRARPGSSSPPATPASTELPRASTPCWPPWRS